MHEPSLLEKMKQVFAGLWLAIARRVAEKLSPVITKQVSAGYCDKAEARRSV